MSDNIEKIFETTLNNYGSPLEGGYNSEVHTYGLLVGDEVSKYSMIFGCANWEVNLGRFDVHFSVSDMGRYNYALRKVHISGILRI